MNNNRMSEIMLIIEQMDEDDFKTFGETVR